MRSNSVDHSGLGGRADKLLRSKEVVDIAFQIRFFGRRLVENPIVVDNELESKLSEQTSQRSRIDVEKRIEAKLASGKRQLKGSKRGMG